MTYGSEAVSGFLEFQMPLSHMSIYRNRQQLPDRIYFAPTNNIYMRQVQVNMFFLEICHSTSFELGTNLPCQGPLVRFCHFGVASVNYFEFDSDRDYIAG